MKELIHAHFDKLLLAFLFLVALGVVLYLATTGNQATLGWSQHAADLILGALIGMITGVALTRKKADDAPETRVE